MRTYDWVAAWLGAAAVLSLLLLANSIRSYLTVWRILAVQQVRQELSRQMVALEQAYRREAGPPPAPSAALATLVASSSGRPLWIEMRTPEGAVLAREGLGAGRLFSTDDESTAFRNRVALYRVVPTPAGEAVVEVFPLHLPGAPAPGPPPSAARPGRRPSVVVELAAPLLVLDPSAIWHVRRDLLIDSSGAVALLGTVLIAGLGFRSYARGRRLESQLEIARQIQSELLPSRTESWGDVGLAAVYAPAEQVGGDFYDAFEAGDGRLEIVVGDVAGKGMPAALVTGVVHGAVRASAWSASPAPDGRESTRMDALNALLCEKASVSRHVSLFCSSYDAATRTLRYVNAGHNPPILARGGGRDPEITSLEEGGPVLGLLPTARYVQADREICPGDVLVLYSDGLVEAASRAGEEYGEGRLRESLSASHAGSPEAIADAILSSARAFVGVEPFRDDVTLVVVKFA